MGRKRGKSQRQPTTKAASEEKLAVSATSQTSTDVGNERSTVSSVDTAAQTSNIPEAQQEEDVTGAPHGTIGDIAASTSADSPPEKSATSLVTTGSISRTPRRRRGRKSTEESSVGVTDDPEAATTASADTSSAGRTEATGSPESASTQQQRVEKARAVSTGAIPKTPRSHRGRRGRSGTDSARLLSPPKAVEEPTGSAVTTSAQSPSDEESSLILEQQAEKASTAASTGAIPKTPRGHKARRGRSRTDSARLLSPSEAVEEPTASAVSTAAQSPSDEESSLIPEQQQAEKASAVASTGAIPKTPRGRKARRGRSRTDSARLLSPSETVEEPTASAVTTAAQSPSDEESSLIPEQQQVEETPAAVSKGAIPKTPRGRKARRGRSRADSAKLKSPSEAVEEPSGSPARSPSDESGSIPSTPASEAAIRSRLSAGPFAWLDDIPVWSSFQTIRWHGRGKTGGSASVTLELPPPLCAATAVTGDADTAWTYARDVSMTYLDLLELGLITALVQREKLMAIMGPVERPKLRLYEVKNMRASVKLYCVGLSQDVTLVQTALAETELALTSAIEATCSVRSFESFTKPKRISSPTDSAGEIAPKKTGSDQQEAASATEASTAVSGSGGAKAARSKDDEAVSVPRILVHLIQAYKEMIKIMTGHEHRMGVLMLFENQGNLNDSVTYLKLACEELLRHAHDMQNSSCPAVKRFVRDRRMPLPQLPALPTTPPESRSDQTETTLLSRPSSLPSTSAAAPTTSQTVRPSSLPSTLPSTSPTSTLVTSQLTRRSLLPEFDAPDSSSATSPPAVLPSSQEITPPHTESSPATPPAEISPQSTISSPETPPQRSIPLIYEETQLSSPSTSPTSVSASTSSPSTRSVGSSRARDPSEARLSASASSEERRQQRLSWSVKAANRRRQRELKSPRKESSKEE